MTARLLLAEDTRDLNRALTTVLEHEGYNVVSAYDGQEALDYLSSEVFDALVLDIMMPKKDGLQVLSEMRAAGNYTPVLLLTAKAEVDDRVAGLDAGADDYLTKPFAMKELLARVRSMTRRHDDYAKQRMAFEDVLLDAQTFELTAANTVRLSVREFELMQTFVTHANSPLTVDYLLDSLWRQEEDAQEDAVQLYVSYLRGKLKWVGSRVTIQKSPEGFYLAIDKTDS